MKNQIEIKCWVGLVACVAAWSAWAQPVAVASSVPSVPSVPVTHFFQEPLVSGVTLSPDGKPWLTA